MPFSNRQDLSQRKGKYLLPLDAFSAAKVVQQGVKENQLFFSSATALGAWLGSQLGSQRAGEGESSTVLLYCHTP